MSRRRMLTAGQWQDAIEAFRRSWRITRRWAGRTPGAAALANMGRREEAAGYFELAMSTSTR